MNTTQKEMSAVYAAKTFFNSTGHNILTPDAPLGYDFAIEKDGKFHRVQVKYRTEYKGGSNSIQFSRNSVENSDLFYIVYDAKDGFKYHFAVELEEITLGKLLKTKDNRKEYCLLKSVLFQQTPVLKEKT